jgi:hypothetical protein
MFANQRRISIADDLKGIMFEENIKLVGSKKKIDYYKLSKQDLITLVKLSNQQLEKAHTKILELQAFPQNEKNKMKMVGSWEKQMRQKDMLLK